MSVKISDIQKGSYGELLGIQPGDTLISINGHNIIDGLDFRFYETNIHLSLVVRDSVGAEKEYKLKKGQYESIGLEFDSYLIDNERSCKNKCMFCFIDQLPKGMRETLYFKDDDTRLSFLFGNYITLTNIDESEIQRIIAMHISPINISIHTMNPELRCKMMCNRFAGEALRFVKMLTDSGIKINCQLVMCPGINDGEELKFSLEEIYKLGENVQSVACVPVGLSKHREGLYKLEPYNSETAGNVIDIVLAFGDKLRAERGTRVVYPSDEFFIIAQRELPDYDFYEDFPQIENGVGMYRDLQTDFRLAMEDSDEESFNVKGHISLVTGEAIYKLLNELLDELRIKCNNLKIDVYPIKNNFFGGSVDVTGLVTGGDIIRQLSGKNLGDFLLVPSVMLKADEDIFLDDITLSELSARLGVNTVKSGPTGENLLDALLKNFR